MRTPLAAVALAALLAALCHAQEGDMDAVRARLQSDFHQGLYGRTYDSMVRRVEDNGYFEESLTGAYHGMFPRTVGGLVSLFLETGELDRCERLLGFVLRAMDANDMDRVAHVIGREYLRQAPVPAEGAIVQPLHPTALYRLDQPERFGGAQEFTAPVEAVRGVEIWLTGHNCQGQVTLEMARDLDGPAVATATVDAATLQPGGDWVRFVFEPALTLEAGGRYVMRAHSTGEGVPAWWGLESASERPLGAGHGRDTAIQPGWFNQPGHVAAFALDTGGLQYAQESGIPILCRADQIDGQAHIIMAWARLALRRGPTGFEDRTYEAVARLMDRTSDWPYLTPYAGSARIVSCWTGLVRNVCFEHSREGRFWDTFDLLTQSFVCAALTDMIRVAQSRHDEIRQGRWQGRLADLQRAIRERMVRDLDGVPVYLEMRLPDSAGGTPFEGFGWVNLSPIAAQWEGVDRDILRNTIQAYRDRALFDGGGARAIATDWWPDRPLEKTAIGKGVGWELVYCAQEGEWSRAAELLNFVQAANPQEIYMEATGLGADGAWHVGDPGNGEQCAWWCWGMSRIRQAVGLPAAP